jgi:hypothetical protein
LDSQVGSNTATYTVDIGTASADRLVVVALASQASGAGFTARDISVWTLTGLSSNTVKQSSASDNANNVLINVTAGDLMFGAVWSLPASAFVGSTQAAAATHNSTVVEISADWTIAATNGAFSAVFNNSISTGAIAAATYR